MELRYEKITKDNFLIAASIQYAIFPEECAFLDYKDLIDGNYNKPNGSGFLVYFENVPVGVMGTFVVDSCKDTVWIDWFGVLPLFRNLRIGTQMLGDLIAMIKSFSDRKWLRVYTEAPLSIPMYKKFFSKFEHYDNGDDESLAEFRAILSCSLCEEDVDYWNNKFLNIRFINQRLKIGKETFEEYIESKNLKHLEKCL